MAGLLTSYVLSISAIVLGLYILYTTLQVKGGSVATYHIGCYEAASCENYQRLSSALMRLTEKQSSLEVNTGPAMEAIEVARRFEVYAEWYHRSTKDGLLPAAEASFLFCKGQIVNQQKECNSTWNQYNQKCFQDLKLLKNNIELYKSQRTLIQSKIDFALEPSKPVVNKPKYIVIENQLESLLKAIDKQIIELQINIQELQKRIVINQYEEQNIQKQILHFKSLLHDCDSNLQQSKYCQEITLQINQLGKDSISTLATKIKQKQKTMMRLHELITNSNNKEQYMTLYNTHKKQFASLLAMSVNANVYLNKKCGCTQAKSKEYKAKIVELQNNKIHLRQENEKNEQLIIKYQKQIELKRKKRQQIIDNYSKIITVQQNQDANNNKGLQKLRQQLQKVNTKIIKAEKDYQKLLQQCKGQKDKLNKIFIELNKAQDCLNKKYYALELQKKLENDKPTKQKDEQTAYKSALKNSILNLEL